MLTIKRYAVAVVLWLLATTAWAASPEWLQQARQHVDHGDPALAVPLLQHRLQSHPDDSEAQLLLGVAYFRAGQPGPAETALKRAVQLAPTSWRAQYNLATTLFAAERWQEAASAFLAIPELDQRRAGVAYTNAALAHLKSGQRRAARRLLEDALKIDPDGSSALLARRLLARLERLAPLATPPRLVRRTPPGLIKGHLSITRKWDSNLRLRPGTTQLPKRADWRTGARLKLAGQIGSGVIGVTPGYDFYGRWYDSEDSRDLLLHRVGLRLGRLHGRWRPDLAYRFEHTRLGGTVYQNSHRLAVRVQVRRQGLRRLVGELYLRQVGSPGTRFHYLAGRRYGVLVTTVVPVAGVGRVRLEVRARQVNSADLTSLNNFDNYSYRMVEPRLILSRVLFARLVARVGARYQFRRYRSADRWQNPPGVPRQKIRSDRRWTVDASLSRKLFARVELVLSYRHQVNRSNLGDDPLDDRDKDYQRDLWGGSLHASW